MGKVGMVLRLLSNPKKFKTLLSLSEKGYLAEVGWFNANARQESIDINGNPVPWLVYGMIDFMIEKLPSGLSIFEYGSGNSTIFYAQKAKEVIAIEHNLEWKNKIAAQLPSNAAVYFIELDNTGKYAQSIKTYNQLFDMIVVDGRDRVNCCKQALEKLSAKGVVILDDSERPSYQEGVDFLKENGFKEIAFTGMAPGTIQLKKTSLFYKEENVFDI